MSAKTSGGSQKCKESPAHKRPRRRPSSSAATAQPGWVPALGASTLAARYIAHGRTHFDRCVGSTYVPPRPSRHVLLSQKLTSESCNASITDAGQCGRFRENEDVGVFMTPSSKPPCHR